jgi:serine/threonine-protein kinase RsbW
MTEELEIKLNNTLSELERVNEALMEFSQWHVLSPKVVHDLRLALEEILTNVISYGYADDRQHEICVRLKARPGAVIAEVEDDGRPFDPLAAPDADVKRPIDERVPGGLGIHLVRKLMDSVEYKRESGRNLLIMNRKTAEA